MYYTTNIKTLTTETWNKIREHVSIYELNLPASNKLVVPEGKEDIWVSTKKRNGSYYYDEDKLYIVEVTKCWTNPKNTIKVVIFGKRDNAYVTVLSRRHPVRGFKNLRVDRYSGENQDVFDNIKVGSWLVCLNKSYNTNGLGDPAFLMNSTLDEVKEAIEGAVEIDKIRSRAGSYVDWRERDYVVPNNGTVHLSDVKATILRCKRAVRRFLWIARKRKWDLKNAVKDKLKMTYNNRFKVVAKGLDGNIWHLDAPLEPNLKIRERFSGYDSIYKLDFWLPFVYQPKYRGSNSKTETFITMLLSTCKGLPEDSFTIGMNKKRIHFERKETSGGAILNYLNGQLMKKDEIEQRVSDYLMGKGPLFLPKTNKLDNTGTKVRTLSKTAEKLLQDGLNGNMEDLEGNLPFHLNLILKERKWYIQCGNKKFHVKGGYTALSKVKTAIEGTAIVNRDYYSWEEGGSIGTRLIKDRLAELVGEKNALWIILNVKRMGAMIKAMKGQ